MKRIICLLTVLALCVCMLPAAFAAENLTQEDVEARAAQAGLEGKFVTLDALGLKLWLLDGLSAYDLPESVVKEKGYVAYYMNDAQTSAVGITLNLFENPNITREEVTAALAETGIAKVETMTLNGLSCLSYSYDVQEGLVCYVITVMLGDGYVAEFAFTAGDSAFEQARSTMVQSIMSAE